MYGPRWPGFPGWLALPDYYGASQPRAVMITKRLEAVRMSCVLPTVLLLVWFGGVSQRESLPGSLLTSLARLSSKHKVNFFKK